MVNCKKNLCEIQKIGAFQKTVNCETVNYEAVNYEDPLYSGVSNKHRPMFINF